jgi:hypothetical protein
MVSKKLLMSLTVTHIVSMYHTANSSHRLKYCVTSRKLKTLLSVVQSNTSRSKVGIFYDRGFYF